jgi:hypothetical protein
VVAKILAGRPKDLEDARSLWRLHCARIDVPRIRRTLRLLEEALNQSDLLPSLDGITRSVPRKE